jgi:glycosyltransferase involved in cell wall biosynthesis
LRPDLGAGRRVKVLYVNHTSEISGGERSLLDLLGGLPDGVSATVACPDGPLSNAVRKLGVPVARVPGAEGSLKLHPWHTTRGVIDIGRSGWAVRRLATTLEADLVHANSIRAGLAAVLAASVGGPPAIVHVHDCLPPGRLSSIALKEIGNRAAVVIPNSHHTAASVARVHSVGAVRVVHGPVDLERFDPAKIDLSEARGRLGLEPSTFALAVVAQITPWKGQDDAIRILELLEPSEPDVRLLLVGSPKFVSGAARYDNATYARALERLTENLGLRDDVMFLGERDDIPEILRAVDLLLVPSWEEPFGLAIVEAMAMEVPVVATNVGGPTEIVRDGEDGLLLPPRAPETWAAAIENLIRRPQLRADMARKARERVAERFSVEAHVMGVLAVYEEALRNGVR